jgi:hypothetical protein
MKKILLSAGASLLLVSGFVSLQIDNNYSQNRKDVNDAVLDYVEAIYEVAPERIAQSVSPELSKVGYWYNDGSTEYGESRMTYDQLYNLAASWNKEGRVPEDSRKDIEIFDVLDQTASVKLTATWGIDYLHLAKVDGKWMIMNIVWQRHPPGTE